MTDLTDKLQSVNAEKFRQSDLDKMVGEAVRMGSENYLRLALAAGGSVDGAREPNVPSPLADALRGKNEALVHLLLVKGADANYSGYSTPILQLAYSYGKHHLMETLIERGADVNAQAHDGRTVLYEAVTNVRANLVKMLLEYGADMTLKCTIRGTSMDTLEVARRWEAIGDDDEKACKQVLQLLEDHAAKAKPAPAAAAPGK